MSKIEHRYTPRAYQNEFMEFLRKNPEHRTIQRMRQSSSRVVVGVDFGEPGGDKTVITQAKVNSRGKITKIIFDEYETWPEWKWYKNPIKWYKWRKLMQTIRRKWNGQQK
jgi:hypothetical protein